MLEVNRAWNSIIFVKAKAFLAIIFNTSDFDNDSKVEN